MLSVVGLELCSELKKLFCTQKIFTGYRLHTYDLCIQQKQFVESHITAIDVHIITEFISWLTDLPQMYTSTVVPQWLSYICHHLLLRSLWNDRWKPRYLPSQLQHLKRICHRTIQYVLSRFAWTEWTLSDLFVLSLLKFLDLLSKDENTDLNTSS